MAEAPSAGTLPDERDGQFGSAATVAALIVLTTLGALARFYRLSAQSLWIDEVFTFNAAALVGREGLLAVARMDHMAPANYWLAWLAMRLGDESAFWLRLPSALAGTLTVPMMYALGRRLFGSASLGLAAAVITAASPFAIWYAQDGRMYAPLILAATVYIFACWPAATGRPSAGGWVAMAAATAAGLYVHHYLALLSVTFGLYLLARLGPRDRRIWTWGVTQVVGALAFVPWMALTAEHLGNRAGTDKPMMALWMPYTYFTFVAGFSLGPSVRELRLDGPAAALREHAAAVALVGAATATAGIVGLRRLLRPDDRWAGVWCLLWAVGPMVLAIAATRVTNINYNVRYAAASFPAVALILSGAVISARRSALAAASIAGLVVVMIWSLWNWYESPRYAKEDLRGAAAYLAGVFGEGDLMIIANARAILTLDHYGFPCPAGAVVADDPGTLASAVAAIDRLGQGRRAWLLEYREWEVDPGHVLRLTLDSVAVPVAEDLWPGVTVRLYHFAGRRAVRPMGAGPRRQDDRRTTTPVVPPAV